MTTFGFVPPVGSLWNTHSRISFSNGTETTVNDTLVVLKIGHKTTLVLITSMGKVVNISLAWWSFAGRFTFPLTRIT